MKKSGIAAKKKTQKKSGIAAKKKTQKKSGIAATLSAAAKRTGLPMHAIQFAKSKDCDAFKSNGRINTDALIEFLKKNPPPVQEAGAPDYFLEKARNEQASRKLKEQKLLEQQKLVWPIEKIQRSWTRYVMTIKSKLAISENAVSVEAGMKLGLTNEQVNAIKEIHIKHNRAALKEMFLAEWGTVNCPDCGKVFQS